MSWDWESMAASWSSTACSKVMPTLIHFWTIYKGKRVQGPKHVLQALYLSYNSFNMWYNTYSTLFFPLWQCLIKVHIWSIHLVEKKRYKGVKLFIIKLNSLCCSHGVKSEREEKELELLSCLIYVKSFGCTAVPKNMYNVHGGHLTWAHVSDTS